MRQSGVTEQDGGPQPEHVKGKKCVFSGERASLTHLYSSLRAYYVPVKCKTISNMLFNPKILERKLGYL